MDVEIERPRVVALLSRSEAEPLRILCAPHGGGKTTALLQYAAQHDDCRFVSLPAQASSENVRALLAPHAGAALTVVDCVEAASARGRDALFEWIAASASSTRRYILSGSSPIHLRLEPARGGVAPISSSVLPFTSEEIGTLALALGVEADALDLEQLCFDTEGWPLAVAWIIRDAALGRQPLHGAYDQWRERNGRPLFDLLAQSYAGPDAVADIMSAMRALRWPASQRTLERLDAAGYPIDRMRGGRRPYRQLVRIAEEAQLARTAPGPDDRLVLTLFGRFSCSVAGTPVTFVRRRDQNVLAFVALAPSATVSRAELSTAFWPGASRAVASQGLRTTLCRLRRALAAAGGCDAARYLRIDDRIALDLNRVRVDARAFRDCVERAQREDADGESGAARGVRRALRRRGQPLARTERSRTRCELAVRAPVETSSSRSPSMTSA
jgi:hypothetical protein